MTQMKNKKSNKNVEMSEATEVSTGGKMDRKKLAE